MNYELAKQLKDAGFPQRDADWYTSDGQWIPENEREYIPTLSELIEACGEHFYGLLRGVGDGWQAGESWNYDFFDLNKTICDGSTPEEAVAKLWLELNKKKYNCDLCKDEGAIKKTEWTGTDQSYEVIVRCECTYD